MGCPHHHPTYFFTLITSKKILFMFHRKNAYDNNVFFEIHPWYFLAKDQDSRAVLIRGRCHGGLYNLGVSSIK
jgi:hypothetical protein